MAAFDLKDVKPHPRWHKNNQLALGVVVESIPKAL